MYKDYSFIMDVDGTLCPIKKKEEKYEDLIPYPDMIKKIQEIKKQGAKIILFSSRNMNSFNGNLGLINKITGKQMMDWLEKWKIPYDEIFFGKPWPGHKGFYVDDRTLRPSEFLKSSPEEMEKICSKDKLD